MVVVVNNGFAVVTMEETGGSNGTLFEPGVKTTGGGGGGIPTGKTGCAMQVGTGGTGATTGGTKPTKQHKIQLE